MVNDSEIAEAFTMASIHGEELENNAKIMREFESMRVDKPDGKDPARNDVPPVASNAIKTRLTVVGFEEFLAIDFPPRENLLAPWLPMQGLTMVHAKRGIGKTYFALSVAVAVASGGSFLNWEAPKAQGVFYLDGEMPSVVMQERLSRIIASADKKPIAPLNILTPDLQKYGMPNLATPEGQALLEPYLEGISLVIIDNISTLCVGGKENEAESWETVQAWALSLRSRGISVLFIHHAGKNGLQRGTSKREDVLDTVISLRHGNEYNPEQGACFEIHFEKARGIYGDDTRTVEAKLTTHCDGTVTWAAREMDKEKTLTTKVAGYLNDGMPQKEIAGELGVHKSTVSKHKKEASQKGLLHSD